MTLRLAAVLSAALLPLPACGRGAAVRPNVVLVSIDTLRADRLGAYGHDRPTSPFIDSLAERSVLFEQAFSQSPKTAPSHMSLLTGLYPEAHGVENYGESGNARLSASVPTLASVFREHGYRTAAHTAGGNVRGELGFDQGFLVYEDRGTEEAIFARARAAIAEYADAPFFLFVHTYAVHDPYLPPERYREQFVSPSYRGGVKSTERDLFRAGAKSFADLHREFWENVDRDSAEDLQHLKNLYDASIRWADDLVAGLWQEIEARSLGERTLFILTSDHGEEFLEHDRFQHDSLYQEVLHVPLIFRLPPGSGIAPRRIREVVSQIDFMPTVLDLAGIAPPPLIQGRSLAPLMRGEAPADSLVWSQWPQSQQHALRLERWKYIQRTATQPAQEELYDLQDDPGETQDLATAEPAVRERVLKRVAKLKAASAGVSRAYGHGGEAALDPEVRERLKALGYLGGGQ
ncbi:MAG: sulfatase [Planctomycetes bacterium]|nr:sulfatase [Planctomycetota bacterium]